MLRIWVVRRSCLNCLCVSRHRRAALSCLAVVHGLALRVVVNGYGSGDSVINVSASPQDGLDSFAPDMAQSPAAMRMREGRHAWAERLPEDPSALFAALLALPQEELLSLLAVCVAATVGAVTPREDAMPAAELAQAVGLDMHAWWTPTAEGYFAHVSKAKAIEAVQVFAPEQAARLLKLKRNELACEAGRLAVGTNWLPVMLRAPVPEAQAVPEAGGVEDAQEEVAPVADVAE